MNTIDRIKTYLLAILILISIIQVGILWNNKDEGFPFSFVEKIFNNPDKAEPIERDRFFLPDKIILSNETESRWILSKRDKLYDDVWDEAKLYLREVFNNQPVKIIEKNEWYDIVSKKAFVFEFYNKIDCELLGYYLNISDIPHIEPTGVKKVAILPWKNLNYSSNTIYIFDREKIYKYVFETTDKNMNREDFGEVLKYVENNKQKRIYSVLKEFDKKNVFNMPINQDVLLAVKGNKYNTLEKTISYVPDSFKEKNTEEKISQILGIERGNFDVSVDSENTIVLRDQYNMYWIYENGIIEYKYLRKTDVKDKGKIPEAYKTSMEFIINEKRSLIGNNEIFLVNVDDSNQEYYEFVFDYKYNEHPIKIEEHEKADKIKNAVAIKANKNKVIECLVIEKRFNSTGEKQNYNVKFQHLIESDKFNEIKNVLNEEKNNIKICSIDIAYEYNPIISHEAIEPVWLIRVEDGREYKIALDKEGEE